MILLLKNIIAQFLILFITAVITLICYVISFFVGARVINVVLATLFGFLRQLVCKVIGIKVSYIGLDNIPEGTVVFASKHESAFETSFFFNIFKKNTIYCFKKEVTKVPLWGRISRSNGGISIDRGNTNFKKFLSEVKYNLNLGNSIAIFPEGTRVLIGSKPKFKRGIVKIYSDNNVPIVPVALNTGKCFPKNKKLIYPTHVIIEFLPPIYPGLTEEEFLETLHKQINDKSSELHKLSNI